MTDNPNDTKRPTRWLITCPEATRLSSERLDRPLGFAERARHRFHLLICASCRRYASQMKALRRLLGDCREEAPGEGLSEAAKARMRDRMLR